MNHRIAAGVLALTMAAGPFGAQGAVLPQEICVHAEETAETPAPTEETPDTPTETANEDPTEPPSEAPTETPSEEPTEAPTEEQPVSEAPSEEPTEAPTEAPTEPPTETPAPSEEPTEAPTEPPAPVAPASLMAPGIGCYSLVEADGSITEVVVWNPIDGANGYEVELSQDESFGTLFYQKLYDTDSLTFRLKQNAPGSTCYVRIRACYISGDTAVFSDYAVTRYVTPNGTANASSPVMTDLRLMNDNKFQFSWNSVEGADHYEIDIASDPNFESAVHNDFEAEAGAVQTRKIKKLHNNAVYYCRLRTVTKQGDVLTPSAYTYINLMIPESFTLLYGDADSNGTVNSADATSVLIHAANVGAGEASPLTAQQFMAADINADGITDAGDATAILMYAAAVGAGQTDADITSFA